MALKYKEDLLFFNKIFNKFYKQHPNFTIQDVLDYLKSNNKIIKINNYKKDKLKKSLINTKLNF
jgi:spore coat polysaccharide biosynthesis protein SpsF (cytidylyltransferase family)